MRSRANSQRLSITDCYLVRKVVKDERRELYKKLKNQIDKQEREVDKL